MPNYNEMMGQLQAFMNNPLQFLAMRGLNIPGQFANDPDAVIQYLMDNGRMNQYQYNYLREMSNQLNQGMSGGFGNGVRTGVYNR